MAEQIKADVEEKLDNWESEWAAADFSWAGLAAGRWGLLGSGEASKLKRWRAPVTVPVEAHVIGDGENAFKQASLQDYWRWVAAGCGDSLASDAELRAAGLLIEVDGTDWFALQRPEVWLEDLKGPGSASGPKSEKGEAADAAAEIWAKAGAALAPLLMRSLGAGGETRGTLDWRSEEDLRGPDNRAQLVGVRAQGLDAIFRNFAGEGEEQRPLHLNAARASFEHLNAEGLCFGPLADFMSAKFAWHATFNQAQFTKDAGFNEAQFAGGAWFGEAQFSGVAAFNEAQFESDAGFEKAQFESDAGFNRAQFAEKAGFYRAQFSGNLWFSRARFSGNAGFYQAQFSEEAWFSSAQFAENAQFYQARFSEDAWFYQAEVREEADFSEAQFSGDAWFTKAQFSGTAGFKQAQFSGTADVEQAQFSGRTIFRTVTFAALADFSDTSWPQRAEDHHAAFEAARFEDVANFKAEGLCAYGLFDGAAFRRELLLTDPQKPDSDDKRFAQARDAVRAAVKADKDAVKAKDYDPEDDWQRRAERGPDARWAALAGGCRTLKQAMKAQGNVDREQTFYRFELKARANMPSTKFWEKTASAFYGLVSDYGASIARPLGVLTVLMVVFALGYGGWGWVLGAGCPIEIDAYGQAATLSWNNSFRPFWLLSADAKNANDLGAVLLGEGNAWRQFGVRAVGTLQSFLSIVLAFLFALAVRRRFQIG